MPVSFRVLEGLDCRCLAGLLGEEPLKTLIKEVYQILGGP